MIEFLKEFFTAAPAWELVLIFCAKIIEVSISTMRMILINKGNRKVGVLLSLVEIFIWIFVAGSVISNLKATPVKGVVYGIGFSVGVFLGSLIEEKVAFGKLLLQIIVRQEIGKELASILREAGFGVTLIEGEGKEQEKFLIYTLINRKDVKIALNLITSTDKEAMVISHESSNLSGGYINKSKHIFK